MTDPEACPNDRRRWPPVQALFRPVLTSVLVLLMSALSYVLVFLDKLSGDVWFTNWMSMIGMMVAFFFGERSALKTHDDEKRPTP